MTVEKKCSTCKAFKALSEFWSLRHGKFGRAGSCIACERKKKQDRRNRRPDRVPDGMRRCKACGQIMPATLEFFHKSKNGTKSALRKLCRPCVRAGWRASEVMREQARVRRLKAPYRESQRVWHLKKFGISVAEYEAMLKAQDGTCAICGKPEGRRGRRRLCVDHDHATGTVRGLLCSNCNQAIGLFVEEEGVLMNAIVYLKVAKAMNAMRRAGISPLEAWLSPRDN